MIIDFKKLFTPSYLFDNQPSSDFYFQNALMIIFGALIVLAVAVQIVIFLVKRKNPVWQDLKNRLFWWLITCGFLGFMLLSFRYQSIYLFSSRFLMVLLAVIFIIWGGFILFWIVFKFPKAIASYNDEVRKARYLPQKRRK